MHDSNGTKLISQDLQWPHTDEIVKKSQYLPKGIYLISIISDEHVQNLKWLKDE